MKNEELCMCRENWEMLREYRKAPFKRKYEKMCEIDLKIEFLEEYEKIMKQ